MDPVKPTVGRVVHYTVSDSDSDAIKYNFSEEQIAKGEAVLPAVIVRVWSDTCVNLKVLTDGPVDGCKTSANKAEGEGKTGRWDWPVKA